MTDRKSYKCKTCGLEWRSPGKKYEYCPDCQSGDINIINSETELENPTIIQGTGIRVRSGMGSPPRVCKCNQCGYESPKTPGVPCRNDKCPECGGVLCGAD